MDKYLIDLIERMNNTNDLIMEVGYDSSKTISWKAYREAENVKDLNFIPQLISFIEKEKNKKKRDKAYFLLGHIAKNTNDLASLVFLINCVNKETDKYIISSLLDKIANLNKPIGTDLQPLILATKNDKWLIRYSAIRSLNNSSDAIVETTLTEIINTSEDAYDIVYSNAVLSKIGTLKTIPYLEKHLKSRKKDVKHSAQYAIEEIQRRSN